MKSRLNRHNALVPLVHWCSLVLAWNAALKQLHPQRPTHETATPLAVGLSRPKISNDERPHWPESNCIVIDRIHFGHIKPSFAPDDSLRPFSSLEASTGSFILEQIC